MEMRHVTRERYLLSIAPALQIWYVVLRVHLELVFALYRGHGIRHLKHANVRVLIINWMQLEHLVV
jgi:hypothetical protein